MIWTEKERAAWKPVERKPIEEWAARNVQLTTKMGAAVPGPYNYKRTPWVKEIFAALADKRIENVIWVAPAQIGKTLTLVIYIANLIDCNPQNILYFTDSDANAKKQSELRIQPMLDGIPRLTDTVEPADEREKLEIEYAGGVLSLAGSQSVSQLSSKSAPIVIRDETSKWPVKLGEEAGALELAGQRVMGQYRYKIVDTSTPIMAGDAILKQFELSDQRYYHVPCPKCGFYQKLVWEQVKWPKDDKTGKSISPAAAGRRAWYECEKCKAKILEREKEGMNLKGRWIAEGGKDEETPSIVGFHLNRLYSPFVTWKKMVKEWLEIGEDLSKRQTFYNAALALPWKQKSVDIEIEMLTEHIDRDLPVRTVPEGYEFVIAVADYHGPRYGVRFVTFALRWDTALALIDYGELGTLPEYGSYLRTQFATTEAGTVMAAIAGLDAGWETKEVVDFCAAQPRLSSELHFVTPIQAAGGGAYRPLYSLAKTTHPTMKQLIIHPEHWKNQILLQLTEIPWLDRSQEPPTGYIRFHRDCGKDLFDELTSEKKIERVSKLTGRKETKWVVVKKTKTHYWDAICYGRALADLFLARQRPRWSRPVGSKTPGGKETKGFVQRSRSGSGSWLKGKGR